MMVTRENDELAVGGEVSDIDEAEIRRVLHAEDSKFNNLVALAGLDPRVDFRFSNMFGFDLRNADLRGFDLTGADLRSTCYESALTDETTILIGALTDFNVSDFSRVGDIIFSVAMNVRGDRIVCSGRGKNLRLLHHGAGGALVLSGHSRRVSSVDITRDGARVASGSDDGSLRIWDWESGACLAVRRPGSAIHSVSIADDGKIVAAGLSNGSCFLWSIEGDQTVYAHRSDDGGVVGTMDVSMSADANRVIYGSGRGSVVFCDMNAKRKTLLKYDVGSPFVISGDGKICITAGIDGNIVVWDLDVPGQVSYLQGHQDIIRKIAVTHDGGLAVSCSRDMTVRIWDVKKRVCVRKLQRQTDWVFSVAICHAAVAIGCADGTVERVPL